MRNRAPRTRLHRIFLAFLSFPVASETARAGDFTVVNTNDSGAGSLREAITAANASPGADQILFGLPTGNNTINIPNGNPLPLITDSLHIVGPRIGGPSGSSPTAATTASRSAVPLTSSDSHPSRREALPPPSQAMA
jgi:hypothetical protein